MSAILEVLKDLIDNPVSIYKHYDHKPTTKIACVDDNWSNKSESWKGNEADQHSTFALLLSTSPEIDYLT